MRIHPPPPLTTAPYRTMAGARGEGWTWKFKFNVSSFGSSIGGISSSSSFPQPHSKVLSPSPPSFGTLFNRARSSSLPSPPFPHPYRRATGRKNLWMLVSSLGGRGGGGGGGGGSNFFAKVEEREEAKKEEQHFLPPSCVRCFGGGDGGRRKKEAYPTTINRGGQRKKYCSSIFIGSGMGFSFFVWDSLVGGIG